MSEQSLIYSQTADPGGVRDVEDARLGGPEVLTQTRECEVGGVKVLFKLNHMETK